MAQPSKSSKATQWRKAYGNILSNNRALAVQNTSLRSRCTRRARDIAALQERIKELRLDLVKAKRFEQCKKLESVDACTQTAHSWMKDMLHDLVDNSEVRVRSPTPFQDTQNVRGGPNSTRSLPQRPSSVPAQSAAPSTRFRSPQRQTSRAAVMVTPPTHKNSASMDSLDVRESAVESALPQFKTSPPRLRKRRSKTLFYGEPQLNTKLWKHSVQFGVRR